MRGIRVRHSIVGMAFVGIFLSLPGCTQVGDQLTGVKLRTFQPTECVRTCNLQFLRDLASETKKLAAALSACQQLPEADRRPCYQAAWAAYEAAVKVLKQARVDCTNGCHQQGSGTAG